jgi:serine/threonine protein kinase
LKHPKIATVYHVGRDEAGLPFIVMEYIAGVTLRELLQQRKAPSQIAALMAEIAETLHYAHQQGFVHRDLKPSNVLLDREGKPHVVDFGLAVHETAQRRKAGEYSGTLPYMSPEQVRGESHRLDGRADIWALGVMLYELLVGRRPFVGETPAELCDEILHREPKPLRMVDDKIPTELERICLKCLSKNIADRFATAADLAAALRTADQHKVDETPRRPLHKMTARLNVGRLGCGVMVATFGLFLVLILSGAWKYYETIIAYRGVPQVESPASQVDPVTSLPMPDQPTSQTAADVKPFFQLSDLFMLGCAFIVGALLVVVFCYFVLRP